MRIGIFFLIFFCFSDLVAQRIVIDQLDEALLEQELLFRINRHRASQGLSALQADEILAEAASDQVFYLEYIGELTHNQSIESKSTPQKRVQYFEGNHEPIGENIAYVSFGEMTYPSVAERLYLYWKQSPADYENMMAYAFTHTGIRFSIDVSRQRVYAVQVLGGYGSVEDNSGGGNSALQPYQAGLCANVDAYATVANSLPNRLSIQGDSIFLDYRDEDLLRNVISNKSDGLALDLITRDQLSCRVGNQFHFSEVHDGYIQPTIYADELFANNRYYGGNKIYTFLGTIPRDLMNEDFQVNVITVNNNSACKNSFPIAIPEGPTPFIKTTPIWAFQELVDQVDPKKLVLTEKRIPSSKQIGKERLKRRFPLYFESNEDYVALEDLNDIQQFAKNQKDIIDTIEVRLYSSIDGSRSQNLSYQQDRVRDIMAALAQAGVPDYKVVVQTEENWPLFYRQIRNTSWESYRNLSKSEVKDRLRNPQLQRQMMGFLREQRKGEVLIKYSVEKAQRYVAYQNVKTTEDSRKKIRQFEKFVEERQFDNALAVQHLLLQAFLNFELNRKDLLNLSIPFERNFLPHLSNMLALEIFYTDKLNTSDAFMDRLRRVRNLDKDYVPMAFNWAAYSVRYLHELNEAVGTIRALEFSILELLESNSYPATYLNKERSLNRLMTNYHLASVDYYTGSRDFQLRDRALKESRDYAAVCKLNQPESLNLALFFNRENYIDWSLALLKPFFVSGKFSENLLFTYTQTRALTDGAMNDAKFLNLLKLCQRRNPRRFCKWLDENFQLMRSAGIKQVFCESCG